MKSKDTAQLSLFSIEPDLKKRQDNKYQYLIVVSPSDEIKEKVLELKKKLNVLVPISNFNLRSTPHISIIGFSMKEQLKDDFWNKFQLLFIKIEDAKPFVMLHKISTQFFKINERNYLPQLTVARVLPRESLPIINSFIGEEGFKGKFKCTNITVLERTVEGKTTSAYKVRRQIELQN